MLDQMNRTLYIINRQREGREGEEGDLREGREDLKMRKGNCKKGVGKREKKIYIIEERWKI